MEPIKRIQRTLIDLEVKRGKNSGQIILTLKSEVFDNHFKSISKPNEVRQYSSCKLFTPNSCMGRVKNWSFMSDPEGQNALFHGSDEIVNMCYIRAIGIGDGVSIKIPPQIISTDKLKEWTRQFHLGCKYYYDSVIKPVSIISKLTVEEMVIE